MLKKISAAPYILWSILFIVFPLIFLLIYAVTVENGSGITFSLSNFVKFNDPIYINIMFRSIKLAAWATLLCLVLGYPMAMILAKMKPRTQQIAVLLFLLPMWMNFLLRTYAWISILGKNGIINKFFAMFGMSFDMLFTEGAVLLGMVYNFLPFMVLPIYTVLTKIDNDLISAAQDLGAGNLQVLRRVIIPLSIPGVVSGITMVFMPAVSTFVISNLLGGGKSDLIGNLIEQQFLVVRDWHFGSTLSIILMIIILITMGILGKVDKTKEGSTNW